MTWHSLAFGRQGGVTVAAHNQASRFSFFSNNVFGAFIACTRKLSAPPGSKLSYRSYANDSIQGMSSTVALGDIGVSKSCIDRINLRLQAGGLALQRGDLALQRGDLAL